MSQTPPEKAPGSPVAARGPEPRKFNEPLMDNEFEVATLTTVRESREGMRFMTFHRPATQGGEWGFIQVTPRLARELISGLAHYLEDAATQGGK